MDIMEELWTRIPVLERHDVSSCSVNIFVAMYSLLKFIYVADVVFAWVILAAETGSPVALARFPGSAVDTSRGYIIVDRSNWPHWNHTNFIETAGWAPLEACPSKPVDEVS